MRAYPNNLSLVPVQAPLAGGPPVSRAASGGEIIDALRGDDQPLYDLQTIVAGSYNELLFFNLGFNNGVRNFWNTNCPEPNRIQGDVTFSVRGIACRIRPTNGGGTAITNAELFAFQRLLLRLQKNDSIRFELRVDSLGGGGGFSGIGTAGTAIIQNGPPSINDYYHLKSFVPFQAEDRIKASLVAENGVPFVIAGGRSVDIEVFLYGSYAGLVDRR